MSVVVALAAAAGVLAYFTTTGTGSASGGVTVLAAPTISSATPGSGTVALSWTAVTAPGSGTVSYYVSRDGGAPEGNYPSSTSTSMVTNCADADLSVGTHNYTVTATWRSWTATSATSLAQVTFGPATHFLVPAASTTPTAGVADNLTITAKDEGNNTVVTYTGSHSLTFEGAGSSANGNHPTVTSSAGTVTNFGTVTAITFTNGVATVAGANNGVMILYGQQRRRPIGHRRCRPVGTPRMDTRDRECGHPELALPVHMYGHNPRELRHPHRECECHRQLREHGKQPGSWPYGHRLYSFQRRWQRRKFTEPATGTSVNLTINNTGAADSTVQFTFKAQSGVWASDTMTAQTLIGTNYTIATATLNK